MTRLLQRYRRCILLGGPTHLRTDEETEALIRQFEAEYGPVSDKAREDMRKVSPLI